jgi:hypothetical protein
MSLLGEYLKANPNDVQLLRQITSGENATFKSATLNITHQFLHNGSLSMRGETTSTGAGNVRSFTTTDSTHYVMPLSSPVQGIDTGVYVMVSINYYTIPLLFTTLTYGENDVLNVLFEGPNAQTMYNAAMAGTNDTYLAMAFGVIALQAVAAYFTLGISELIDAVFEPAFGALEEAISQWKTNTENTETQIYDSTYQGQPQGNQYIWVYYNIYYYYPITLVGVLASSAGLYGVLSDGSSVTLCGNYPSVSTTAAIAFSAGAQSISKNLGSNHWEATVLPSVTKLGGTASTPNTAAWPGYTLTVNVPSGISHTLLLWAIGGSGLSSAQVGLPSTMVLATSFNSGYLFSGAANGTLTAGTHTITLTSGGQVNVFSLELYGTSNDVGYGFQFASAAQVKSLSLASGGIDYFGVASTGGGTPITSTSMNAPVDQQTSSLSGGETAEIGQQSSSSLSMTPSTQAVYYGMTEVAFLPETEVIFAATGLSPGASWSVTVGQWSIGSSTVLAIADLVQGTYSYSVNAISGYSINPATGSITVGPNVLTTTIAFTPTIAVTILSKQGGNPTHPYSYQGSSMTFQVPSGVDRELFVWAVGTLPNTGMSCSGPYLVQTGWTSLGGQCDDLALEFGADSASFTSGQYTVGVNAPGGSVNFWSMIVYGFSNDAPFGLVAKSAIIPEPCSLAIPAGGIDYIGMVTTQGQDGLYSTTLPSPFDESVPSLNLNGPVGVISQQISPTLGMTPTYSLNWGGLEGIGVEPLVPVTFSEAGLPAGSSWSITAPGTTVSSMSNSLTLFEPAGSTLSYSASSSGSYSPYPNTGTLTVKDAPNYESISYLIPPTISLISQKSGQPNTNAWGGYSFSFTVPAGTTHELFVWSVDGSGLGSQVPTFPAGVAIQSPYIDDGYISAGLAVGQLTPSQSYQVTLAYSGQVNVFSIVVYGTENDAGFGFPTYYYDPLTMSSGSPLTVPPCGSQFIGVETTGGGQPVSQTSFATIDEYAPALSGTGNTAYIGRQSSNVFWMGVSNQVAYWAEFGLSVCPTSTVTFTETGLPPGTAWSVTLGGIRTASTGTQIEFEEPIGTLSYSIGAVTGYTATPASGTVTINNPASVSIAFAS